MEVDASKTGVGAVLWREVQDASSGILLQKTATEQNYELGNQEILAVKLVLEEWRHWLEEDRFLFVIFTEHKKPLEYLKTTEQLNPLQAQ